ncbi:MAG: N-acetylmuramoyl-L-alanine amidase [Clostridia bacterium]|nr:N-acetylmuramoyl-L-alanine amidase [Clostridia bacterium]MDD4048152.1 N-acetylmuramoyl-L-alanine amidase [Clostridia bacterium]
MELDIKWIGSQNYGLPRGTKGRRGNKVIAIVDHIMEGTLVGTDAWFNSIESEASAHFGIGKSGEIHQYVDLNNVAWHTGKVSNPSWALLIKGLNPNYYTIGIEHEGYSGEDLTENQFQATLELHRILIKKFNLEVNKETIIGHFRIDSVNKYKCPGVGFPWKRLFNELQQSEDEIIFSDIPPQHWAAESVRKIKEVGIMVGYSDGTFRGEENITRYELASALDRLMN